MWDSLYIFNLLYCIIRAETYNTYKGVQVTKEELANFKENNITNICTSTFEPCDETEWRRIDGSCNNLEHPTLGMYHTPMWRMLEANYSEGFNPRKTKSGEDLPPARYIRSLLVPVGNTISQHIATSASYFAEFAFLDVGSVHDIDLYITKKTKCCEGSSDSMCAPNLIPSDDHVHRFSNLKCLNMTKPISFQNTGCVAADSAPERINYVTTFYDLSNIYLHKAGSIEQNRAYEGGRLKVEVYNGRIYPSDANENTTCFIKESIETDCTRNVPTGLIGTELFTTFFWRLHNHIADCLAELNPCWDDEKLMYAAREMNIGIYSQILYHEYFALMLGKENLIKERIIHSNDSFRDIYNPNVYPKLSLEYAYAQRWFHITQDGLHQMHDANDNFIGTRPITDFNRRVQLLAENDTMVGLTHGLYMQPAGGFDNIGDPIMTEVGLGHLAKAFDILTADLSRGKYFGLQPYIQYRDFCTNYTIEHKTFEDLKYIMDVENIELAKKVYNDSVNMEVMAGMWLERLMKGTWVTPTVYCFMINQLKRTVVSDRHMYDNPNRPHAYTEEQLKQVRKASLAGMLCTVGDQVTEIQPRAFERIGPGNEKVSCDEIPSIDFSVWKDDSCSK